MKKIIFYIVIGAIFGAATFIIPRYLNESKKSVGEKSVLFIPLDASYSQVLDSVSTAVMHMESFNKVASRANLESTFKPGRYVFTPDNSNKDIVRILQHGWQSPMMLTLSGNIRGMEKLSGILGKKLACDSAEFAQYFASEEVWKDNGFEKETFMAMFLPNTYEVYWTITPGKFVERMKKEYDKFWNQGRLEKAKAIGLSPVEVSILASIVCEETNYTPEMPRVAGVYMNRLNKGMKLDADPTVKFALGDPSIRRILFRHLEIDSPYNTYLYAGLPPGPITIPSIRGIDAVLDYEHHNYLYFCANANMDGTHKFARTLSEHNRNARAYQAALNKLKIR